MRGAGLAVVGALMDLLMHRMWVRRKEVARPLLTSPRWETLGGEEDPEVRVDPSVRGP